MSHYGSDVGNKFLGERVNSNETEITPPPLEGQGSWSVEEEWMGMSTLCDAERKDGNGCQGGRLVLIVAGAVCNVWQFVLVHF
jgi:hypothetical protein